MPKTDAIIAENALRELSHLHVSKVAILHVPVGSYPSVIELAARSGVVFRRPSNSGFATQAQRD
ncbi:hypothetical protein ACC691_26410 [Rhizobium johnstonii]|uniref:hypothetical protein n=1 Tax=Rhizobium johnstonii TaxID=3019933 RepID=UPI003F9995EF